MKFVEPKFKILYPKILQKDYSKVTELLNDFEIVVILGAPGSGKSIWLKELAKHNQHSKFLTVQQFIDEPFNSKTDEVFTLLLDGLDEYRSTLDKEKVYLVNKLTSKINDLSLNFRIVLSCRELDWYGESDKTALENNKFNKKVCVIHLLPFDVQQQFEMIQNEIRNQDSSLEFFNRFEPHGIMSNPQMLSMLLALNKSEPNFIVKNKTDLYQQFIRLAEEKNIIHQNTSVKLNQDERLELLGYLAFYYFFSNQNKFNKDFLNEIKWQDEGYFFERLEAITKTSLFNKNGEIIHRTLFEFALAKFFEQKLLKTEKWSVNRILVYLSNKGKIYSEFRGVYSWLCSSTHDIDLIKIDPYNQLIYGDNSAFTAELKKLVLKEIETYAKEKHPYFYNYNHEYQFIGFYEIELDHFLLEKIESSKKEKNHFGIFICAIISVAHNPSDNLINEVKRFIDDPTIPVWFKTRLIKVIKAEDTFLLYVMNSIIKGDIADPEFDLMTVIFNKTYPNSLTVEKLKDYLPYYKSNVLGHALFLEKTPNEARKDLISFIYSKCRTVNSKYGSQLRLPESLEFFVEDYFMELVESYPTNSADYIYETLKFFKIEYLEKWEKLEFRGLRYYSDEKKMSLQDKFQDLANKLFKLFVEDWLENETDDFHVLDFSNLFDIATPENRVETILSLLNKKNSKEKNFRIYLAALRHRTQDDKEKLYQKAKEYDFEDEYNRFFNPEPQEWEIEQENQQRARVNAIEQERENNETFFSSKNDNELKQNFSVMKWFANHFYVGNSAFDPSKVNLDQETFKRLFNIFKSYYRSNIKDVKDNCTLELLAKKAPMANRTIDWVVYTSISATNWDKARIPNKKLHQYLYILCVLHEHVGNIIKNNFLINFEKQHPKHIEILKSFALLLFNSHASQVFDCVKPLIEFENNVEKLKQCIRVFKNDGENIYEPLIFNYLIQFGLELKNDNLEFLYDKVNLEKSKRLISGLIKLTDDNTPLTKGEIYNLIDLFGRYSNDYENFKDLDNVRKIRLIKKMMDVFDTEESVSFKGDNFEVARFLKKVSLDSLEYADLEKLLIDRQIKSSLIDEDFWQNEIKQMLHEKFNQELTFQNSFYTVEQIKKLLKEDVISSYPDFFRYVVGELNALIQSIESNRLKDKSNYYDNSKHEKSNTKKRNKTTISKEENDCTRLFLQRLFDRNEKEKVNKLDIVPEYLLGDNRADFRIKLQNHKGFEIYVEAKKDKNPQIITGLKDQLIDKYLNQTVTYGVYLVYYFGEMALSKEQLLSDIDATIPLEYKHRIKVLCLDLKL